jgi:hypothetical protein
MILFVLNFPVSRHFFEIVHVHSSIMMAFFQFLQYTGRYKNVARSQSHALFGIVMSLNEPSKVEWSSSDMFERRQLWRKVGISWNYHYCLI